MSSYTACDIRKAQATKCPKFLNVARQIQTTSSRITVRCSIWVESGKDQCFLIHEPERMFPYHPDDVLQWTCETDPLVCYAKLGPTVTIPVSQPGDGPPPVSSTSVPLPAQPSLSPCWTSTPSVSDAPQPRPP